eukprot:m.321195 g.321195  ORF g.321195 m.321195 type:complete len:541 (-) comp15996_c1_seq3:169-1791(-)
MSLEGSEVVRGDAQTDAQTHAQDEKTNLPETQTAETAMDHGVVAQPSRKRIGDGSEDWLERGDVPTKYSSAVGLGRCARAWLVVVTLIALGSLVCAAVSIQLVKDLQSEVAELQQQSSSSSSVYVNTSQFAEVTETLEAYATRLDSLETTSATHINATQLAVLETKVDEQAINITAEIEAHKSAITTLQFHFGTPRIVDSGNHVGWYSSLSLSPSGYPVMAYYDNSNTELAFAECLDETCSNVTLRAIDTSGDNVGWFISLALTSSGIPVMSYLDVTNRHLKLAVCGDASCSASTIRTVDTNDFTGFYTSVAITSTDSPVISYHDFGNRDLKLAVCDDTTCSTATIVTVDSSGKVGEYTSIALTTDGSPVISYYDGSGDGALKLAVCGDATCSTSTIRTVDSDGNVGQHTSLVLTENDYPAISYYDVTNGNLKLAVCDDETCSTSTIRTVDDDDGDVGEYTSIRLNANSHPIISYHDATNFDVKVAVCRDATCSTSTIRTVVSDGDVGYFTSLAVTSNGSPVVSYFDNDDHNLLVVSAFI